MATILKGAPVVAAMNEANAALCTQLKEKGIVPTLAVVRVGEREDDLSYERGVMTRCGKVGVEVRQYLLPAEASQEELLKVIAQINADNRKTFSASLQRSTQTMPSMAVCCSVPCPVSLTIARFVQHLRRKRTLTASQTALLQVSLPTQLWAMPPARLRRVWRS